MIIIVLKWNSIDMGGGSRTNRSMFITDTSAPASSNNYNNAGLVFYCWDYTSSSTYAVKSIYGFSTSAIYSTTNVNTTYTTRNLKYNWDTWVRRLLKNWAAFANRTDTSRAATIKSRLQWDIYFHIGGVRSGSSPVFRSAFVKLTKE